MFFYAENLVTQEVKPTENPWEYIPVEKISKQIRFVREDRQNWYQNENTRHCFYSGLEGINPNMRVSKENPPHLLHAFIADYDTEIPDSRLDEVIPTWRTKPTWIETSLGGNRRLVWVLVRPLPIDSADFFKFIMQKAAQWLTLDKLPALDGNAFTTATRVYCNGCVWKETGHPPLSAREVQAFYVECGQKYDYKPAGSDREIPLDVVERELKNKYPNFTWPSEFEKNSQGPTFWIPESTSPQSAIVKDGGIFTYAAHATKPFYSWADLLGASFAAEYTQNAIAKATENVVLDGQEYYRIIDGQFQFEKKEAIDNYFRVNCGLTTKPGQDGVNMVQKAFAHIHNHNRVQGIASHVFRRPGIIRLENGQKHLNIYSGKPLEPAPIEQDCTWGPHGGFPFFSRLFEAFFDPLHPQLEHWLANLAYFYKSILDYAPLPGQASIYAGAPGTGKTLINRYGIGYLCGGFVDASKYLIHGGDFTAHLFTRGYWVCDDDNPGNSETARLRVASVLKQLAANQEHVYHKKYGLPANVEWCSRLGVTTNMDYISTQIISLSDSAKDKVNLYRCNQIFNGFPFPPRDELIRIRNIEWPRFARYLLTYKPPTGASVDQRFGWGAYQEPSMMIHVQQTSESAPFREVLLTSLERYFQENPESKEWKGSTNQCCTLINSDPARQFDGIGRFKANFVNNSLDRIHKEKLLECKTETGKHNVRLWVFKRPTDVPVKPEPTSPAPTNGHGAYNPFEKK